MKENKFKVGDWVVPLVASGRGESGSHCRSMYEVYKVYKCDTKGVRVYTRDGKKDGNGWLESTEVRHATPKEIKTVTGSDLDIDKEFVLPKRWCIKITKENLEFCKSLYNNELGYGKEYNYTIGGFYSSIESYLDCYGTSEVNDRVEITFEQFKKYVLKKDMKEEVKYEVGKWYKTKINNKIYYGKFLRIGPRNNFVASEFAMNLNKISSYIYHFEPSYIWEEIPLSEIQQYLPEGHSDKIKVEKRSVGTWVVCIKRYNEYFTEGSIAQIEEGTYTIDQNCVNLSKWAGNPCMPFKHCCEWFKTKQEAEEFSKSLTKKEMKFKIGDKIKIKYFDEWLNDWMRVASFEIKLGQIYTVNQTSTYAWELTKDSTNVISIYSLYGGYIPAKYFELVPEPIIDRMDCPYDEGTPISCYIGEIFVEDAKIHYENDEIYICQNVVEGSHCNKELGYNFSWNVVRKSNINYNTWQKGLKENNVTEVRNKSLDPIDDSVSPDVFFQKEFMTSKSKVKRIEIYTESTPVVVVEPIIELKIRKVNKIKI